MEPLTEKHLDHLALHACDTIGYRGGRVAVYDVAGYDRIPRQEMSPSRVKQRERETQGRKALTPTARFEDRPYLVRIGGFRRGNLYGPDEIGATFRRLGIAWNDSLGMGLYESLLIDRKYGLAHSVEAPVLGHFLPFLDEDWARFETEYRQQLHKFEQRLRELEPVYGAPVLGREEGLCVLNFFETPLSLFALAHARQPQQVSAELERVAGCSLPPVDPASGDERLALAKFWAHSRARHGRVLQAQSVFLRQLLGSGATIIGNFHELPVYDFEGLGAAYDYPAVAVRPLLLEDEVMLRHYIAYFTQLFHDLTGKPPFVSVRVNLSAAGTRFVPGENLIRHWYDQAVRHGAGGFYFWPRDYPMDMANPYDGPMLGNPEPNTLPEERWNASLQSVAWLATHQRFIQPAAQVAILVPRQAALLQREEWRRIYATFSACAEAQVHCRFLGDWQVAHSGIPAEVRLLLSPALEFLSTELRGTLERFTRRGGSLLVYGGAILDEQAQPTHGLDGATRIPDGVLDIFPLDRPASPEALLLATKWIRQQADNCKIDDHAWLFDVTCADLPPTRLTSLRQPDDSIEFVHWLYEHGSNWIYPYLKY